MDPQTASYWASIVGVPIAIIGLILTYFTLKNRIETIGTQINTRINQEIITKIENIAYQLRFTQTIGGNHYENCIIVKGAESPEKIVEKYRKSMEGMTNNE